MSEMLLLCLLREETDVFERQESFLTSQVNKA